jgi:hypothetical protein
VDNETLPTQPSVTIGLILGGAMTSRAWEAGIKKLMGDVESTQVFTSGCRVQVTFDVPGELTSPPSAGIIFPPRPYKPPKRKMYVGVGLPPEPELDAYGEALQFLKQAVEEASAYLQRKRIPGDLEPAMEVVRCLSR